MKLKSLHKIIPAIISLAIFIAIAILMSTIPTIKYGIDEYFFVNLTGSSLMILLTFIVWIPTGEDKAREEERVINNKRIYDTRANFIVKNQMFIQLKQFCDTKNEELRKEIIRDRLAKKVINYNIYELFVKQDITEEEQKQLDAWLSMLDKSQLRLIKKLAKKGVRFTPLTPKDITMGSSKKYSIVNKNNEKMYKTTRIIGKCVWGIFTACYTYFVVIVPNENFGVPQITMIIMWFFTFLMTIYSAIQTGYKSIAVYRDNYYKAQAELCAEFFSTTDTKMDEVDKLTVNKLKTQEN